MRPLDELLRPHLRTLVPYASARDEYSGTEGIFLDANENPLGSVTAAPYNRYPDPLQRRVKALLAPLKGVAPEQIFLGNGSDEAIDLLLRAFGRPGVDNVITLPPTYGMYGVSARVNDLTVREVPLTPAFELGASQTLSAADEHTKLIFLCSPNNPTGNALDPDAIERVVRGFDGLVVLDEAYVDFCPEQSWLPRLTDYPNLVVLQTFSKAWGLAGLRLGAAYAHPDIIDVLNRIKPPYNLSAVTQHLAEEALRAARFKDGMVAQLLAQRIVLAEGLAALPNVRHVFPSDANFLLARVDHARRVYEALIDRRVILRDRSRVLHCDDCLRVTVGTAAENEALLAAWPVLS